MYNKFTIGLLGIILFTSITASSLFAQKHKTADKEILTCIAENKQAQDVVDSSFSAYRWARELEKNCGKVIEGKHEAGLLFEIAQEKNVAHMLLKMASHCKPLKTSKKYLKSMHDIFKTAVKTKKTSKKVGELFTESVESVSLKKYHLRKIRKRAAIIAKLLDGKKLKVWEKLLN